MKVKYFLPILLVANYIFSQGSNPNTFAFPSVNNSFLGKTGPGGPDIGVDYYTGMAQVSIPVCTLPSKELEIPVSLQYVDGKGVKLHEYASQVGLGWQLNAGGSITRVVRAFPDEQPNGYLGTGTQPSGVLTSGQQWGKFVSGLCTGGTFNLAQSVALFGCGSNPNTNIPPTGDGEPDLFYVRTPFFSFQFTFNASGVPVFSNSNGYKIISTNFVNTTNYPSSSFEVIDDQGNQFYFGSSTQSRESSQDSLYNVPYTFISTWYLDKIVTYNSKDNVILTYQAATTNDTTYNYSWCEAYYGSSYITTLNTGRNIIYQPKFVSTIVSSQGEVDFNYIFNTRQDDHNVPYLNSIITKGYNPQTLSNSTVLQTYNFNYGYFGTPSTDPNVLRLDLNSITVTGNSSSTSTPLNLASFGYNTTYNLPNRTWLVFDYWGYCNSTTNPPASSYANLTALVQLPSTSYAQADLLNSITTTQGGTWNIYYEANMTSVAQMGGLRVNKIAHNTTGQSLFKTYQYVDNSGNNSGQIYSSLYNNLDINIISPPPTSQIEGTIYYTGSPYIMNDINGIFIGYSWVKEADQNGGYSFYNFSNFNDAVDNDGVGNLDFSGFKWQGTLIPYINSSTSVSYKRGLLLSKATYNSAGTLISQTTNSYSALVPVQYDSYGICISNFTSAWAPGNSSTDFGYSVYSTPIENYRLTQTVNQQIDQKTPTSSITSTVYYKYDVLSDPLNTYRLIDTATTTDSKGISRIQSFYYNEDVSKTGSAAIPMLTTPETTAINAMISNNKTGVLIHSIENRNGTLNQIHNSYTSVPYGTGSNIYLGNTSHYTSDPINTNNTLVNQKTYNYDAATSDLISYNNIAGLYKSLKFGYNSSMPTVEAVNAVSTIAYSNQSQTQTGYIVVPGGAFGSYQATFTTYATGTITISMPTGSYLAGSVTCFFSYSLTGPLVGSGNLCNSSVSGYTCSAPNTYSYNNAPAGTYTVSVSALTNTATSNITFDYSYTGFQIVSVPTTEFFFEGFEENNGAVSGNAHTGNMYYSQNYTVPYTPPNGRKYLIQWWNLTGGVWNFNQQTYTTNMVLTGPLDDIRVFPSDGLITTYTYNPMVGKTSMTDPSGRSEVYQYDGLGRLNLVRDNDGNITKKYCYTYTGQTNACPANATLYCQYNMSYAPSWNVVLTNLSNNSVYNFTIPYYVGSTITLGTVPTGNYNVSITEVGSTQSHYIDFGSYDQSGSSLNLSNIPITGNINVNIPD